MGFVGRIDKKESSSQAYNKVGVDLATHLKVAGEDEFIEISESLVIRRKGEKDAYNNIHYSEMVGDEKYVCVVGEREVEIEPNFYAQIAFMTKSEGANGTHFKCDNVIDNIGRVIRDGIYVRRDEIQIPAYKKVETAEGHHVLDKNDTIRGGKYYAYNGSVTLKNGQKIYLPNPNVVRENLRWYYIDKDGKREECAKYNGEDKAIVDYVLIDGERIVEISKLQEKNGAYVIEGEEEEIGEKRITLERPFIQGTSDFSSTHHFIPNNLEEQRKNINRENVDLKLTWNRNHPGQDGIVRVEINGSRTIAKFFYRDGTIKVFAKHGATVPNQFDESIVTRVDNIDVDDTGDDGIRINASAVNKSAIAQDVEFKQGRLVSYSLNGNAITGIEFDGKENEEHISTYTIDGVTISNIEWHNNVIKSCVVHKVEPDGTITEVVVDDIQTSEYKNLAITYNPIKEIEDVKIEDEKVSFKLGDYTFKDAEIAEDGSVKKCIIVKDGKEQEVDLSTDKEFEQLRLAVQVVLKDQDIVPLVQSNLLEKRDGKYVLTADLVQTGEMKDGVAGAKNINSVEQAVKEQQEFVKAPYKTWVIDKEGKVHPLNDLETTYEGTATFDMDLSSVNDYLLGEKIEYKKGNLALDTKAADKARDDFMVFGFWLCSNPITAVFGVGVLAITAVASIVAPIMRNRKQNKLKNVQLEEVTDKMQDKAKEKCQENINKLVSKYAKLININKKKCSTEEFNQKLSELREQFSHEYHKIVGGLNVLDGGSIECAFDMSQKTKITQENYLGFLECMKIRKEMQFGKQPHPDIDKIWKDFRETKFVSQDDRLLKEVELLRKYGGREDQILAYQLEQHNLKLFLDQENKIRKELGQSVLSLEDYKKITNNRFNEGKLVWGGISDKLEAYKQSEEYLMASRSERKKLLKNKEEELNSALNKVSIDKIKVAQRLDKKGNPVFDSCVRDAMAYMEEALTMFSTGDTKIYVESKRGKKKHVKKFSFGYYDRMSASQKEANAPRSINDSIARRHNTSFNRRLAHDKAKALEPISEIKSQEQLLSEQVKVRGRSIAEVSKDGDYVTMLAASVEMRAQEEEFQKDCIDMANKIDELRQLPNKELVSDQIQTMLSNVSETTAKYKMQNVRINKELEEKEKQHRKEAEIKAIEEFANNHTDAYKKYCMGLRVSEKLQDSKALKNSFYKYMAGSKKLGRSAKMECEMLKIKYHAKESVEAETFCEMDAEGYKKFIEHSNSQTKGAQLNSNSEDAKCLYYAHCMQTNPTEVRRAREDQTFVDNLNQKLKQKVEDQTLGKHEEKKEQDKKQNKENVVDATAKEKEDETTHTQGKGGKGKKFKAKRSAAPTPIKQEPALAL